LLEFSKHNYCIQKYILNLFKNKKVEQILYIQDQQCENAGDFKQIENIHFNINYSLWTFDHNIKVLIRWSHDGVLLNENGFREVFVVYHY
jgi:hypothetical protein